MVTPYLVAVGDAGHQPVLPVEVLALLAPKAGEVAVDLTLGAGGHAALLAAAFGPAGTIVGFDLDEASLEAARTRLGGTARLELVHESFVAAPQALAHRGLRADVVLADLGFSSVQMDDPQRGFSFQAEGPLDMRFDRGAPVTAADLLARLGERELADLIFRLGEDPFARRIAHGIAGARRHGAIRTTTQLAQIVRQAYGPRARFSRMHPATRTFMALRIAVNAEIEALEAFLGHVMSGAAAAAAGGWLRPGARIAVISFHSLEDRLVKHAFAECERRGLGRRLTRRPVTASPEEIAANPRARSAKLRAMVIETDSEHAPRLESEAEFVRHS
jgi:16S rRNA (cytosine1402-N4)-methyltransferase